MKRGARKNSDDMSASELAESTREFEALLPTLRCKPATKANLVRFERARKAGIEQPGIRRAVFDDEALLTEALAPARRRNMVLGELIERGLHRELAVLD